MEASANLLTGILKLDACLFYKFSEFYGFSISTAISKQKILWLCPCAFVKSGM
jgi:hypothetical protein